MTTNSKNTKAVGDSPAVVNANIDIETVLDQYLASAENIQKGDDALTEQQKDRRRDEVLRAVNFLYGKTLEGALAILDTCPETITRVVSIPSQRSLYLVKGSSSYSRSKRNAKDSSYVCIVPRPDDELPVYFCACRSFLERTRRGGAVLCKHLLAVRLMAALDVPCSQIEATSDQDFSKILLGRISID